MLVIGIDLETTGLNPEIDKIIEIGAVLWSTDYKTPLKFFSEFIYREDVKLSADIQKITGISDKMLKMFGRPEENVFRDLQNFLGQAEIILGHNINEFDKLFLEKHLNLANKQVIDTRTDLPLKYVPQSYSLRNLCTDHEIINYFPHRAMTDALITLKLFSKYKVKEVLERSQIPNIKIQAIVSFADKDLAKQAGFHWKPETKQWWTVLKECDYRPENYNFKTKVLK